MNKIRYYRVLAKNGRAYWVPTKTMKARGFNVVPLGFAGPAAEALAAEWNDKWDSEKRRRVAAASAAHQYVYFVQVGERVKIGISRAPISRVGKIVREASGPIKAVVIVVGSRVDERRLHDRFAAYRTNGEWFVASRPIRLTISRCAMAGVVIHDGDQTGNEARTEAA